MAAVPVVFTLTDQMGACGVDNVLAPANGLTKAGHIAQQVFQDRYDSTMRLSKDDLDRALKRFSALTVATGQIKLPPGTVSNILGFIQYSRDEIRLGRDPQFQLYDQNDTHYYLDRMDRHEAFVKKSESVKKPKEFSADIEWEDWDTVFRRYLNRLVGRNGIPLSYVIRENDAPNPEPNPDFLQDYVMMAELNGPAYAADADEVMTILTDLIVGNERAESVIRATGIDNDGRVAYKALKASYEGEGLMQMKITDAEKTIRNLKYIRETPGYTWVEFENKLKAAYRVIDRDAGYQVHNDGAKLRALDEKIQASFLQAMKISINTEANKIPCTMTFETALRIYRNGVQQAGRAAQQGAGGRNQGRGRGISEVSRGRGNGGGHHGGRGRGGNQGGRNQNRNQRRKNGGNRRGSHPDEETIVLRNGKHIKYHASYDIPDEDYHQMTPGQKDRMKAERAAWKRANGDTQRGGDRQDRIAQLERQIQALQQSVSTAGTNESVPREVHQGGSVAQISQVTANSGGSIMGGRRAQQQRRQGGQG